MCQDLFQSVTTLGIKVCIKQGRPCFKLKQNRLITHQKQRQALQAKELNLLAFAQE